MRAPVCAKCGMAVRPDDRVCSGCGAARATGGLKLVLMAVAASLLLCSVGGLTCVGSGIWGTRAHIEDAKVTAVRWDRTIVIGTGRYDEQVEETRVVRTGGTTAIPAEWPDVKLGKGESEQHRDETYTATFLIPSTGQSKTLYVPSFAELGKYPVGSSWSVEWYNADALGVRVLGPSAATIAATNAPAAAAFAKLPRVPFGPEVNEEGLRAALAARKAFLVEFPDTPYSQAVRGQIREIEWLLPGLKK